VAIVDKVSKLNRKLETLLNEARRNEQTLKKFQAFELSLMNSASFEKLLENLLHTHRERLDWDLVTLALVDSEYEIRTLLERTDIDPALREDILFLTQDKALTTLYGHSKAPILCNYSPQQHAILFINSDSQPASVGLLPLIRNGKFIGSFNLGSFDRSRFQMNTATDFLQHLAAIIAVSIEINLSREQLKHIGLMDKLTEVNNRHFFDQRLLEEIARSRRTNSPISCLFVDADHFKQINDNYGHQAGDQVLRHVARILRREVRAIDIVARYGGEEFIVLLLQSDNAASVEVAERIRRRIENTPFETEESQVISLTISIGVNTLLPDRSRDDVEVVAREFIENADKALYAAKRSGRNRVINFRLAGDESGTGQTAKRT